MHSFMKKYTTEQSKEDLRKWLVKSTAGCNIQGGWPCGTCTIDLLTRLGLDPHEPEYSKRNEFPDRANEVWRAILQIRDATNLIGETYEKPKS